MIWQIFVQGLGLIAWILLVISYWKEDINKILLFQLFLGLFFAVHYFLLGATEGLLIIVFELMRDFSYYKTNWDKYIFVGSIPIYIIMGIFSFDGLISLFPSFASVIDGFTLVFQKRIAIIGAIISCSLWFVYDFISGSYVGFATEIIMIISNYLAFVFDDKEKVN